MDSYVKQWADFYQMGGLEWWFQMGDFKVY